MIRKHLSEVLCSTAFTQRARLRRFLRYVVEETAAGHYENLQENRIAVGRKDESRGFGLNLEIRRRNVAYTAVSIFDFSIAIVFVIVIRRHHRRAYLERRRYRCVAAKQPLLDEESLTTNAETARVAKPLTLAQPPDCTSCG